MRGMIVGIVFLFFSLFVSAQTITVDNQLSCDVHLRVYAGPGGNYADCPSSTGCGQCCIQDVCIPGSSGPTVVNICAGANAEAINVMVKHTCASSSPCTTGTIQMSLTGCLGYPTSPQSLSTGACTASCGTANFTVTWIGTTVTIN
jgi:hypothetical protein